MLSLEQALAASAVMAVGSALQGAVGFGVALIAAPLLVLINPRLVPGPLLVAALGLTLLMSHRERHGVDYGALKWAILGRIPGGMAGAWLLTLVQGRLLAVVLGTLVLSGVGISLIGIQTRPTSRNLFLAGTLSGFMGTASSIGGPPMALLYQHAPGATLRGMLSVFFVWGTVISVGLLAVSGLFGRQELLIGLCLIPGVVIGFLISGRIVGRMNDRLARPAVLLVSATAAVAVIVRAVWL